MWENQLAQVITIRRSAQAAQAVRGANDLTTELLTANAVNQHEANAVVRQEMERGVSDIEALKADNYALARC